VLCDLTWVAARGIIFPDLFLTISLFSPDIIPCPVTADIAFIVDSSGSIGVPNYVKTKYFVYSIANALNISSSGAHAGVVIYSEKAKRPIKFTDHTNIKSFKEAVYGLEYMQKVMDNPTGCELHT
jgi:hypothetical protein